MLHHYILALSELRKELVTSTVPDVLWDTLFIYETKRPLKVSHNTSRIVLVTSSSCNSERANSGVGS